MKFLIYTSVIVSLLFASCNYEHIDRDDNEAFLRLNWFDREPAYIDPGGAVPDHFSWNTYYRAYPGTYLIYYEYAYNSSRGDVVYSYEIEIEMWLVEEDHYNDRREDVYFDLEIFPDWHEFYHEVVRKNYDISNAGTSERTLVTKKRNVKNGYCIEYSVYELSPKKINE
ncbi:MAG: hypothetical protein R6U95_08280 [Bacteroidales bacterium]